MSVKHVTDGTFEAEVLKSDLPVLVDFWAPWCSPCRALSPIIDDLAGEFAGKVNIAKINVDENPASPGQYGIRAIPTLMLFKDGKLVDQLTGASSKEALADFLNKKALA